MQTTGAEFQRGKFKKYWAKMKIRVGGSNVPVDILQGDEFLFDGTVLKYGGGEYTSPQTRGAINAGWATDNPQGHASVNAHHSTRSVAKATSVNRDLSRVQRNDPSAMGTDHSDEDTVMDVSDRRPQQTGQRVLNVPNDRAAPRVMTAGSVRGMEVTSDGDQEGVSVGRVRTAAKVKADMTTSQGQSVASRLNKIEGSGFVPNGSNRARGHNVLQKEGILISTNVTGGRVGSVEMSDMDEGEVVGHVRNSGRRTVEGISVEDTSNIRDRRAQAERVPAKAAAKVQRPASKPVKVESDNGTAAKIKTAKTIDPKFPEDWNFFAKLDERIKLIKKNDKNRKFLQALFVVEGASVRAHLTKAYPKMFG